MKLNDVRQAYFDFFKEKEHVIISSASLIPQNDPTTLFTGSGMQPLLQNLLGASHSQGKRIANAQKCFRAEDIDEVGDNRHTTFFEMLGNWSLGDYFKKEQLQWLFVFLTDRLNLDPNRLYVTVFSGDSNLDIPKDEEAALLWRELFAQKGIEAECAEMGTEEAGANRGMKSGERIFFYGSAKNWWSRSGLPQNMPEGEPGGPDSEVFYDFGIPHDKAFGKHCHPNCDCGRFMEIGNSVFMQYVKNAEGTFSELSQKNVDFGGGLERLAAASNNEPDVFLVDTLKRIVESIESQTNARYSDTNMQESFRIVADHLRAAVLMSADGIKPSNTEAGYVLRRLVRRALRHLDKLDVQKGSLESILKGIFREYNTLYVKEGMIDTIIRDILEEEARFEKTLAKGLRYFQKCIKQGSISADDAFDLFTTYGFPLELTKELAEENKSTVDTQGFHERMQKHRKQSQSAAQHKFKGGLADTSDKSIQYHTATHLLHQALRTVLGTSVFQKGSNITPERLRFDFSFERKMTEEEKQAVENMVNQKIREDLEVLYEDIPLAEAQKRGAIGLFEEKYEDFVRVYSIGDYSLEYCGGPHVEHTGLLGTFKIIKDEAVSSGVRRIRATLT